MDRALSRKFGDAGGQERRRGKCEQGFPMCGAAVGAGGTGPQQAQSGIVEASSVLTASSAGRSTGRRRDTRQLTDRLGFDDIVLDGPAAGQGELVSQCANARAAGRGRVLRGPSSEGVCHVRPNQVPDRMPGLVLVP
jgi:hypothetical protein